MSIEPESAIPRFQVVAKDKAMPHEHAFSWWPSLNHHKLRLEWSPFLEHFL